MVMEYNSLGDLHAALQGTSRNGTFDSLIREHDGLFKFKDPGRLEGKTTFKLEFASPGTSFYATPTVTQIRDPGESWALKPIRMAYNLWGARGLKAVQEEVTGAEGAAQAIEACLERDVPAVVAEVWPREPLEVAIDRLQLEPCVPKEVFGAWLSDTSHGDAFSFGNLDRARSRVSKKQVSLTFVKDGIPLRLEFAWKENTPKAYRLAMAEVLAGKDGEPVQRYGGYGNLRELMTQCLRQHVELEAPEKLLAKVREGAPVKDSIPTKVSLESRPAQLGEFNLFLPVPVSDGSYDGDALDLPVRKAVQRLNARCAEEARVRGQLAMVEAPRAAPARVAEQALDDCTRTAMQDIQQAQWRGFQAHRPEQFAGVLQRELAPNPAARQVLRKKGKSWGNVAVTGNMPKEVARSAHVLPNNAEPLPPGTCAVAYRNRTSVLRDIWLRLRTGIGTALHLPLRGKPGRSFLRSRATGRLIEQQTVLMNGFVPSLRPPVPANKGLMGTAKIADLASTQVYQGLPAFLHRFAGSLVDDRAHRLVLPEVRKAVDDAAQALRDTLHEQGREGFRAEMAPTMQQLSAAATAEDVLATCDAVYDWLRKRAENSRAASELVFADKANVAWQAASRPPSGRMLAEVGAYHVDRMAIEGAIAEEKARAKASHAEQALRLAGEQVDERLERLLGQDAFSDAARRAVAGGLARKDAPGKDSDPIVRFLLAASRRFTRHDTAVNEQESMLRSRLDMVAVGRATLGDFERWERNERQYALDEQRADEVQQRTGISEEPVAQAPVYRASNPDEAMALHLLRTYSGRLDKEAIVNRDKEEPDVNGCVMVYLPNGEFEQIAQAEPVPDGAEPSSSENRYDPMEQGSETPHTRHHSGADSLAPSSIP
ncbi:hypothetical protein [Paracidovorax citrulli]